MDSLPPLPAEMIGTSDFLDVSVLRLVSRQARDTYTPCAARITVIPTGACEQFLSNITAPFSSRTIVRLTDASECMSILEQAPHLWCNVKRVICMDTDHRVHFWLPYFDTLFPNVDSLEILCDNIEYTLVVGEAFSKFRQDLKIASPRIKVDAPILNAKNLTLDATLIDFDPAINITVDSLTLKSSFSAPIVIHKFPVSLTVQHELHLIDCRLNTWTINGTEAVLGPVFHTATNVSIVGDDAFQLANLFREGMAARRLVVSVSSMQYVLMLRYFFAHGPLSVEHLVLRGVPMDSMLFLYDLPCLRDLDMTPTGGVALRAPPAGLASLTVRFCPNFFGNVLSNMMMYVDALRTMCRGRRTERLVLLLYDVSSQERINRAGLVPRMTLHDGAP